MIYIIILTIALFGIFIYVFIEEWLLSKTIKQYNELLDTYDELLVKHVNTINDLYKSNEQIISNLNIMKLLLECETIEESNKILEDYIKNLNKDENKNND